MLTSYIAQRGYWIRKDTIQICCKLHRYSYVTIYKTLNGSICYVDVNVFVHWSKYSCKECNTVVLTQEELDFLLQLARLSGMQVLTDKIKEIWRLNFENTTND